MERYEKRKPLVKIVAKDDENTIKSCRAKLCVVNLETKRGM